MILIANCDPLGNEHIVPNYNLLPHSNRSERTDKNSTTNGQAPSLSR